MLKKFLNEENDFSYQIQIDIKYYIDSLDIDFLQLYRYLGLKKWLSS